MSNTHSVRSKGVTTSDPPLTNATLPLPELGPRRDSDVGVNDMEVEIGNGFAPLAGGPLCGQHLHCGYTSFVFVD